MRRAAVFAVAILGALTACGGGTTAPLPARENTNSVAAANARAAITLRFPTNFHTAMRKKASDVRTPAYINPTSTYSLVVTLNGTALLDPSNGNAYFALGTPNPDDNSSTLVVALPSGTYNPGSLTLTEFEQNNGTGNIVAGGSNGPYTDAFGNYHDGTITIAAGSTNAVTVTMQMNVAAIAITEDIVMGSGSQAASSSGCFQANNGDIIYAFAADGTNGFVLPGTAAGYAGGDPNNNYPGIPAVSLNSQSPNQPGDPARLVAVPGGYKFVTPNNFAITANFSVTSPYNNNFVYVSWTIEPSCP